MNDPKRFSYSIFNKILSGDTEEPGVNLPPPPPDAPELLWLLQLASSARGPARRALDAPHLPARRGEDRAGGAVPVVLLAVVVEVVPVARVLEVALLLLRRRRRGAGVVADRNVTNRCIDGVRYVISHFCRYGERGHVLAIALLKVGDEVY